MKHLLEYDSWAWETSEPDYDIKVGDKLYCIHNRGVNQELEIGKEYTVDEVYDDGIFRLKELGSRWMKFRFSKDPNHPSIAMFYAKKYNI